MVVVGVGCESKLCGIYRRFQVKSTVKAELLPPFYGNVQKKK